MSDTPPAKILIVDDEAAQMKALCNTLKDHGYETVGFSSGKMALVELEKTEFDLLLSDLMMPEMDGIALLQAALKINPNSSRIIMTGEGTIATAVEAMKSGALDYILKPFKLSAILPVPRARWPCAGCASKISRSKNASKNGRRSLKRRTGNSKLFPIPFPTTCAPRCVTSAASPECLRNQALRCRNKAGVIWI